MANISEIKQREVTDTPVLLFDCELPGGLTEHWSTHQIDAFGNRYAARVLKHNGFDLRSTSEDGLDGISKVSLTLANADSYFSEIDRSFGFKGAKVTVRFAFVDLASGELSSDHRVVFKGLANPVEEITEEALRVSFVSRMSLQRTMMPQVRIQRRCPWAFPSTPEQRRESLDGGALGRFSAFYRCGYSPDATGGVGSLDGGAPYVSCDYSRAHCEARGMFSTDSAGRATRRFGGVEFVPSSILVKSYGDKNQHLSTPVENEARYNDFVPMVYGTAWYRPPIIFARNDGNLTHLEILLGIGEITGVLKVVASGIEIPAGQSGRNMTGTGWFNLVTAGSRSGAFNVDFADGGGRALGDPYGSMAVVSVVVPNRISDGSSLPRVEVLLQGMRLSTFGQDGFWQGETFTNNPAWVLLDILRRTGWNESEIDTVSFARTASYCDEPIPSVDANGNPVSVPRFQCNLVLSKRRSAADVIRGIRNGAGLFLVSDLQGRLQLLPETAIAQQQPTKPEGSNSSEQLNGGWPAFEFGDGSEGFGDILRRSSGEPTLRVYCRSSAETPNRFTIEFQDEFNEYQQDSLSLVDIEDSIATNQEITAALPALGLPNFNQAGRVARLQLNKALRGNVYVDFETGLRGIGLKPGDLITLTYLKEGFDRQLFRILKISPGVNYSTSLVSAQIHREEWYVNTTDESLALLGGGRQPDTSVGIPRPLIGVIAGPDGESQFSIVEAGSGDAVSLAVGFSVPNAPSSGAPNVPVLSLAADVASTGGTLHGGVNYYYAVTAVGSSGGESQTSFIVRASIPSGTGTNSVALKALSFGPGTAAFNVYRGNSPTTLYRIAEGVPVATLFTDTGEAGALSAPPDRNFEHANFYWRYELLPETPATAFAANSVGNADLQMSPNRFQGAAVRITEGTGAGQERTITANTATDILMAAQWDVLPDATSRFVIADAGWQLGATAKTTPATLQVPRRDGATVHVCGRAANVHNRECAYEVSPVTRHRMSGEGGQETDAGVPPAPAFAISTIGDGSIQVVGIAFEDLLNTNTISAATLSVFYFDELTGAAPHLLASAISADDGEVVLSTAASAREGSLLQIGSEILRVVYGSEDGRTFTVLRRTHKSTASTHAIDTPVLVLERKAFVMPFVQGFFGSPASGSYEFSVAVPGIRIAAAEMYVTNARGNGPVATASFTNTVDEGLRTLSGGQISLQIEGFLAIQNDAVPEVIVDAPRSVRDIFATVREAPTEWPIELLLRVDDQAYCPLTIAVGNTLSTVVDGRTLPPLNAKARVGLDIVSVGQTFASAPGRDLTVTVRL
jgi:hypothetical protein